MIVRVLYNDRNQESRDRATNASKAIDEESFDDRIIVVVIPVKKAKDHSGIWVEVPINRAKNNGKKAQALVAQVNKNLNLDAQVIDESGEVA